MDIRLDGRVALVTGATGGIGSAIATEFYKSGATIFITGRNADKLQQLENKLRDDTNITPRANQISGCAMDLMTPGGGTAAETLIDNCVRTYGRLDILVNNAAMIDKNLIIRSTFDFVDHMTKINYVIPYMLTRASLPYMRRNKYGRIINMTSVSGQYGDTGTSAYAASKSALTAFTKTIADEYGGRNITANCVAPGLVNTSLTESKLGADIKKDLLKRIPAHRFGYPREVADLITFLASERAAYINGQEIAINGGLYR